MDRILVGLDSSPRSPHVLGVASDLARRTGGQLVLFRAVGVPHEIPVEAYSMTPGALSELLEKRAKESLDAIAATLPPHRVLQTIVGAGTPWEVICRAAEEHGADLIVIGSHGYSGLDRLIGTTASKVVNHAACSVLVVRSQRAPV